MRDGEFLRETMRTDSDAHERAVAAQSPGDGRGLPRARSAGHELRFAWARSCDEPLHGAAGQCGCLGLR